MTDEQYEAKYKEMQKYAPFLQRVIEKLKASNDQKGDNPRKAQLEKMEVLYDLLTNQAKKFKMERLIKCEGVLIKLHAKIEKHSTFLQNKDPLLKTADMPSTSTKSIATTSTTSSSSTSSSTTAKVTPTTAAQTASSPSTAKSTTTASVSSLSQDRNKTKSSDKNVTSAPASPSPERTFEIDDVVPVVIPTERRISLDSDDKEDFLKSSVKEKEHKSRSHEHKHRNQIQDHHRSKDYGEQDKYQDNRDRDKKNVNPPNQRTEGEKKKKDIRHSPTQKQRSGLSTHHSGRNSPLSHHRISKDLHNHSSSKHQQQQSTHKKEPASLPSKSNSSSFVQTVKVVITEPLPENIAKRHFPQHHQYRYQNSQTSPPIRDQRCFNNIEIIPVEPKHHPEWLSPNEEPYNPDESWEKYNESEKMSTKSTKKSIFQRLSDKVPDDSFASFEPPIKSSHMSIPSRSTSVPDVLKSPPLSATDINNLLKESGAEHVSSDISEIGSRRAKKPEGNDTKNSLDYVRKKFAQIAKLNSQQIGESIQTTDILGAEKNNSSPNPNERVALKYNPHPRQDRLQSLSSNDGSECSYQSTTRLNTSDPRLKMKIQTSPSSLPPVGVNVLPSINVNDPRLKRHTPLNTTTLPQPTLPVGNNPMCTSTKPPPSLANNYVRSDPRVSRTATQTSIPPQTPIRRMSISQSYISPEHNLDSDAEERINKNDPRMPTVSQHQLNSSLEGPAQLTPPLRSKSLGPFSDLPHTNLKAYTPQKDSDTFIPFGVQTQQPPYLVNPYGAMPLVSNSTPPPLIPFATQGRFMHSNIGTSAANRFNSALNDSKERMRYFESKKQKCNEPRTYLEFKKAKERAQALETASKKANEEAQAAEKKKIEDTQAAAKKTYEEKANKETEQHDKTEKQHDKQQPAKATFTKIKELPVTPAGESTLDKMYRTQNFTTQFPKSSLSFKIPKKKSEDSSTTEATKKDANKNSSDKKSRVQEKPGDRNKEKHDAADNNSRKTNKAAGKKCITKTAVLKTGSKNTPNPPKEDDAVENWDSDTDQQSISTLTTDKSNEDVVVSEKKDDQESDKAMIPAAKSNPRDPRCRLKEIHESLEKKQNELSNSARDTIKSLGESEATEIKTKNKDKLLDDSISFAFSSNTEFKPQRILRRRCTMVSIGSAPLVEKDKLLKANALMLEDIEERDKLMRKKEEEDRQTARRNKQLEEMFRKTDDNCSVSTQNIITGKRRTRPSINFNETQNAINVFKHKSVTKKDTPASMSPQTHSAIGKNTISKNKAKTVEEIGNSREYTDAENTSIIESYKAEKIENTKKGLTTRPDKAKGSEGPHNKTDNKKEEEMKCIYESKAAEKADSCENNIDEKNGSKNEDSNGKRSERTDAEENSTQKESLTEEVSGIDKENPKPKREGKQGKPSKVTNKESSDIPCTDDVEMPTTSKATSSASKIKPPSTANSFEEHQNCVVSSSTSNESTSEEHISASSPISRLKEEVDDNEPSSTGSKSSNPTPTPPEDESSRHAFLNEFVQEIIKPNADKQHILSLLGQILSEDKMQIIKTVIDSTIKETEDDKKDDDVSKPMEVMKPERRMKTKVDKGEKTVSCVKHEEESAEEDGDEDNVDSASSSTKLSKSGRSTPNIKKKRNELDRLNDDIRDMFICEGVLTASGKRMCTLMNQAASKKDVESQANKRTTGTLIKADDMCPKKKSIPSKATKAVSKPLRRSLRGCKSAEVSSENVNDDEVVVTTYIGSGELTDEICSTDSIDTTPTRRKMPVLKPHTPIKLPEEDEVSNNKRKLANKPCPKSKKSKQADNTEKESEAESSNISTESDDETIVKFNSDTIRNTNIHWHNQSKYTSWCMLCNKKILAMSSSFHYKMHHGENYISRLAPILLQKFKQGKMCQPLFGVERKPKQPLWFHRCPFCLQYFNTALPLWLEHFLNHTAEFRYECSKCHWGSNRMATTRRHIAITRRDSSKNCKDATVVSSVVKLTEPSVIKGHVCHLCNFLQLKRANLERHYIEQHQLSPKNVNLLGYTITLFDHTDVELVSEDEALAKEEEARELIEKDEKVIDLDNENVGDIEGNKYEDEQKEADEKDEDKCEQPNVKIQNVGKKNAEKQTEQDSNTTSDNVDTSEISKDPTQSDVDIISNELSENTRKEVKTANDLNEERAQIDKDISIKLTENTIGGNKKAKDTKKGETKISKAIKPFPIVESIQNPTKNDCNETVDSVVITVQNLATISPDTNIVATPSKDITKTKQQNVSNPPKVTILGKPEFPTPTKSQIATANPTIQQNATSPQKESQTRKPDIDAEPVTLKERVDELNDLISLNADEVTTTSNENATTRKREDENEDITPESPFVQLAARKYTLVFTEGDQCSLNEIPEKANTTLPTFNCEIISKDDDAKEVQDELLSLAAQVAEEQESGDRVGGFVSDDDQDVQDELLSLAAQAEDQEKLDNLVERNENVVNPRTTGENESKMSDLISASIDILFQGTKRKSEELENNSKKHCSYEHTNKPASSNVFIPSSLSTSSSPVQILAQSIVNIEEQDKVLEASHKPVTISIAERLSQVLQEKAKALKESQMKEHGNLNDCPVEESKPNVNLKDSDKHVDDVSKTKVPEKATTAPDEVTVISDDEDWEDIEITESAPNSGNNSQKAKNKGLFQKFGLFKSNTIKPKKHVAPLGFISKKKTSKEKAPQQHTVSTSAITTKFVNVDRTHNASSISPVAQLGFKPVISIMEDLLPDSPCNDPIDLVPELTPLEPLTDLNDISSILDSNLSALNSGSLHIDESHTCIQDALDFISEQTANEHQSDDMTTPVGQIQTKSPINKVENVGYSLQPQKENNVKFYCLLENCSFLFSSDAMGLENHFLCEHAQIKWKGYCLLCQTQCFSNDQEYSITKEIKHMIEKHINRLIVEPSSDSSQHSALASQGGEDRPRIKLRRMTGDCLSTSNSESPTPSSNSAPSSASATTATSQSNTLLGALLKAKPMPPTKEMPPQPAMPLTEPLLIDNSVMEQTQSLFTNVSNEFVITSVASGDQVQNISNQEKPLQIASAVSLNAQQSSSSLPKISNVCTLSSKMGGIWSQQIEEEKQELLESAAASLEVSNILANARKQNYRRGLAQRSQDDSPGPVVVAETLPVLQAKAGDFVITQTVSAQYGDDSAAAVGFNISIESSALTNMPQISNVRDTNVVENVVETSTTPDNESNATSASCAANTSLVLPEPTQVQHSNSPVNETLPPVTSRQYKCMGNGCKFTTRVPVAMSDHLRFHERRNLSLKCDYFACAFCSYQAEDVDDYMKHSDQYHIISKGNKPQSTESDTGASVAVSSRNICDILSKKMETTANRISAITAETQKTAVAKKKETEEDYLKKLRDTIDEIVGSTGLPDDKLYLCVIKNCRTQLNESTFHNHIMYHIRTLGVSNPNNYVYKCPHCTAQYQRPAGIKAHIKNHARNRYFCYLCDVTSANPGQMLKHFSEKHWHTLTMTTKELLKPNIITKPNGKQVQDSSYYVTYTNDLSDAEVRKYGEKLILEWQRKKSGSKTHFKSSEIDLLPIQPIFQREVNCGECEYKTKVRTNMYRHLQMHKQYSQLPNNTGQTAVVASVDPVNPVPCLNSTERFFDKMTNLASSSLIPSQSSSNSSTTSKSSYKLPRAFIADSDRFKCGIPDCNYVTISPEIFHSHLSTLHASATFYRCPFCQEELCKRGMSAERVLNHLRFHASTLFRCEECNYTHHLRYVVERHINEKHSTQKVNIYRHDRSEGNVEGTVTAMSFIGKNYKDNSETSQPTSLSSSTSSAVPATRSSTSVDGSTKSSNTLTSTNNAKTKAKWICDICKHKSSTLGQIQMHCQNSHGQNKPYQCMHCQFGSQQLSQILYHIDEVHQGKARNARYIYHRMANDEEFNLEETRPLWKRNDPTRVRHIRGILMEDEEESETYRKKLGLDKATNDDDDEEDNEEEDAPEALNQNFIKGYEFGCFHCEFKSEKFDEVLSNHYKSVHCANEETTKPFIFRLLRRVCCPECRKFTGNFYEMQLHLQNTHNIRNYYAADISIAENDDNSQRLVCGYCSFHCSKSYLLMKHFQGTKVLQSHSPQDVRIESHIQMLDFLKLGNSQTYFQCTLCSQIFGNRVSIVHHAVNFHANDDGFSFKELTNTIIYHCALCPFSSTTEATLMRHMIDHYGRFKRCNFCYSGQISFEHYMQHCYAEHREEIGKFRELYPYKDISAFLLQMCLLFPNGLMLSKKNLLKTGYGSDIAIQMFYEEMHSISQQPPIPRLSIARLVARKSIEAQHKLTSAGSSPQHTDEIITDDVNTTILPNHSTSQAKKITKRRCTFAIGQDEDNGKNTIAVPTKIIKSTTDSSITNFGKRRKPSLLVEHESSSNQSSEFNVPLAHSMKIKKRRRTVASDHNENSPSPYSAPQTFVVDSNKAREQTKAEDARPAQSISPALSNNEKSSSELEYFSYYGIKSEPLDLSKVYTKVAIGGINTPLTIDKFRLLFNIDCQLKLTKCDVSDVPVYTQYKHIKKACPASHKLRYS